MRAITREGSEVMPLGSDRFLARIEKLTGRVLKPGKRGPKPADRDNE